ncbi:hypothetical protein AB395_00005905 (plasmid) [Sinorhizobium fredii CCBAU 45436]|nr:hypothetical protein SF83666_b54750 [Sinorhizobium fredii CCBAU 83666]AWI61082.1 hypothetical protein AB395_00005905 [Sinorhizobium fredii CCBAU 45436]
MIIFIPLGRALLDVHDVIGSNTASFNRSVSITTEQRSTM